MNVTKSGGQKSKVRQGRNRRKNLKNRRGELEEAREGRKETEKIKEEDVGYK